MYSDIVKTVPLHLEDEQHKKLIKVKKKSGLNWVDFVMQLVEE